MMHASNVHPNPQELPSQVWSDAIIQQDGAHKSRRSRTGGGNETHRKEEEELVQLALEEVVGQVAHGIGPQGSDVSELAMLLPPQGCHPFYYIIGDLHQPCQQLYYLPALIMHPFIMHPLRTSQDQHETADKQFDAWFRDM